MKVLGYSLSHSGGGVILATDDREVIGRKVAEMIDYLTEAEREYTTIQLTIQRTWLDVHGVTDAS